MCDTKPEDILYARVQVCMCVNVYLCMRFWPFGCLKNVGSTVNVNVLFHLGYLRACVAACVYIKKTGNCE